MFKSGNNRPSNQAEIQQLEMRIEGYKREGDEKDKTIKIY
jgi:hypothetical protein